MVMATYFSEEQQLITESVCRFLDSQSVPYELKDHSSEGGAYLTLQLKEYILYLYDNGEAEISGPPYTLHFEIDDFESYQDLRDKYLIKLDQRLKGQI